MARGGAEGSTRSERELTLKAAGELTGVSGKILRRYIREGRLEPASIDGNKLTVTVAGLREAGLLPSLLLETESPARATIRPVAARPAAAPPSSALDRLERERLTREGAEREKVERARIAREAAESEIAERARLAREAAAREEAERAKLERERAERVRLDREKAEREKAERDEAERARLEREKAERARAEREKAEREKAEREKAEREKAEREKAGREKAERAKAEREKAEREKAEREESERRARDTTKVVVTRPVVSDTVAAEPLRAESAREPADDDDSEQHSRRSPDEPEFLLAESIESEVVSGPGAAATGERVSGGVPATSGQWVSAGQIQDLLSRLLSEREARGTEWQQRAESLYREMINEQRARIAQLEEEKRGLDSKLQDSLRMVPKGVDLSSLEEQNRDMRIELDRRDAARLSVEAERDRLRDLVDRLKNELSRSEKRNLDLAETVRRMRARGLWERIAGTEPEDR